MNNINELYIRQYLWYGYCIPDSIPCWLTSPTAGSSVYENHTEDSVASVLDIVFDELLAKCRYKQHIVLLSGGWDSRLILGELMSRVEKRNIDTLSFGRPGQLDFDIGKEIAGRLSLSHEAFNLGKIDITWEDVCAACTDAPWVYYPDNVFNFLTRRHVSNKGANVWSGFLGDPLTGSHLATSPLNAEQAIQHFCRKQQRQSANILSDYNPADSVPALHTESRLTFEDQLNLGLRQRGLISSLVLPGKQWGGWTSDCVAQDGRNDYWAPFIHPQWAHFWLSAPRRARVGRALFLDAFKEKHPMLYKYRAKSTWGASPSSMVSRGLKFSITAFEALCRRALPGVSNTPSNRQNYLDMTKVYRESDAHSEILRKAIDVVDGAGVLASGDVIKLWDQHRRGRRDYAGALSQVVGLAANLYVHCEKRHDGQVN